MKYLRKMKSKSFMLELRLTLVPIIATKSIFQFYILCRGTGYYAGSHKSTGKHHGLMEAI
jgi:hypothetical protein